MKTAKTFIVWFLLLCLPLQAAAAVSMMSCSTMSGAQSYSAPADEHCQPQAQADADDCRSSGMCVLAAALAPAALGAAFHRPAASGPIAYIGAYDATFFPDGLERPPHNTPS